VEQLREFLLGWWAYHTTPQKRGKDYLAALQKHFVEIFPGIEFRGVAPREGIAAPTAGDFYFLLARDGVTYDLAEMSSGEQAIFPLVYEFVRLDIARSVVLLDELELHLHPPQQQALLQALRRLGPDCQFIISTHSPFLADVIPRDHEFRLPGGYRSL
jgi:predicted ATPase